MKHKTRLKLGILSKIHRFSKEVDETLVIETIERMNQNPMIHGILVQLPLPKHFNTNKILNTIHPTKDVDGMGTMNAGKLFQNQEALFYSCTPRGCIELLDEYNIRLRESKYYYHWFK